MIFVQRPLKSTSFGLEFENKIKKKSTVGQEVFLNYFQFQKAPQREVGP